MMEKGPLIGGGLLALAAVGVVAFYFVMSSGNTGTTATAPRVQHTVADLEDKGTAHEVVGKKVVDRPDDPVAAALDGNYDKTQHGELSVDEVDEIKAIKYATQRRQIENTIESHAAKLGLDPQAVRTAVDDIWVKREAVNIEAREGFMNPRQARKAHAVVNKEAEERMTELFGDEAVKLREALGKKRLIFF